MALRWSVGVLLAASVAAQPALKKEGGYWVAREQGQMAAKPAVKVIAPGKIRVAPSRDGQIHYYWTLRMRSGPVETARATALRHAIQIQKGSDYSVIQVPGESGGGSGELNVQLPTSTRKVFLQSSNGELFLEGLQSEVQAVTAAGGIEMDRVGGNVVARSGGGALTFGEITGSLRVISGGGTIRAARIGAEAVLETAGGEVYVGEVGGTLRVSTDGNIHVVRAGRMVSAHTSGGMIEVESAGGIVTAESMSGGIVIGTAPGVRCESANGSIRIGNVTGSVRASTANGNLHVTLATGRLEENSFLATGRGDITVMVPSNLAATVKALNESSGNWTSRFYSEFPEVQPRLAEMGPGRPLAVSGLLNGGGPLLMLSTGNGSIQLRKRR